MFASGNYSSYNNLQECQKGVGQRQQVPREWFTALSYGTPSTGQW